MRPLARWEGSLITPAPGIDRMYMHLPAKATDKEAGGSLIRKYRDKRISLALTRYTRRLDASRGFDEKGAESNRDGHFFQRQCTVLPAAIYAPVAGGLKFTKLS